MILNRIYSDCDAPVVFSTQDAWLSTKDLKSSSKKPPKNPSSPRAYIY